MAYSPVYSSKDLRTMFNADPPSVGLDLSETPPAAGDIPVAVGAPIPRRLLEEDGGSGDGPFAHELYGGIGAFDPGAGWPSYDEFLAELSHIPDEAYPSPTALADMYAASIPQSKPVLSGIFERPLGKTFENLVSDPSFFPGMALSMTPLGMLAGPALRAMSKYTTEEQRRHHSLAMQGIEGYSSGTIGGNRFTISPGLFGLGVTGNVNVDVGTIQNMQAVAAGIDPNTGLSLVSGTGQGGYNEAGDWVDEYGNVMGGTMESAQDLADKHGISLGDALAALADARSMPGTTVDEKGGKNPGGNVMGGGLGMSIQARQSRAPAAAILGRDYADEGGYAWESEDWSEEDEGDMPEDDPTEDDYYSFNTGGPVIKRRGSRDTATSPLAAGSFVDSPLYDRARAQYKVNF